MPFELSVNDCSFRNVEHRKSFLFYSPLKRCRWGGAFFFLSPRLFSRAAKWPLYLCTQLVQQQDARCTTTYMVVAGGDTHKYSSIIIGLYDPSFFAIAIRPFLLLPFFFLFFFFSFLFLHKKKMCVPMQRERERPSLFSNVCACAVTLARPRLALNLFMDSTLLVPSCSSLALRTSAVPTRRKENGDDTRVWPLSFLSPRKRKVPFKTEMIREQKKKKKKRKMFQHGASPSEGIYRRRIIIWMGI